MEYDVNLNIHYSAPDDIWEEWHGELKGKLTVALGYEIGEPEDGFEFKYWG